MVSVQLLFTCLLQANYLFEVNPSAGLKPDI